MSGESDEPMDPTATSESTAVQASIAPAPIATVQTLPRPAQLSAPKLGAVPSTVAHKANPLTNVGGAVKQLVPHVQYQLSRLGPAGQAGLASLIAAAVVTASALIPARNAIEALQADIVSAQQAPHSAARDEDGLSRVVTTLPTRAQVPAIVGLVFKQAQATGVPLDSGHYAFTPAKPGGVGRYELEFPVKAGYPEIRNFINQTLAAVPAAGLQKLHIERKAVGETQVNADVRFVIFVRSE